MKSSNSTSLIAAFATIKSLSDEKKYQSPYQLLAEFIRNIITEKALHSFHAAEMKNLLADTFGFVIPEAVIRTTARNMAGIQLSDGIYYVSITDLGSDSLFSEKKKEADETNSVTIDFLIKYINERTGVQSVAPDTLTQELVSFLIGEPSAFGKYNDLIGEFILSNEHNSDIQDFLNRVKEGSIIYIGLNHNISETGSITKPLTLYLGTEILFSLAGYNGAVYKQLADDFYNQVRAANSGTTKKITLRYFSDTKKEIDDFFSSAIEIVDGRRPLYNEKPAMTMIINGCEKQADVSVKQADFYHNLQYGFGITEDSNTDFYDEVFFESNLESFDYIDDDDKKKKKETGIKYISHINKLRNGQVFGNDIDSEYLLITNTKATLLISKEQSEKIKAEQCADYIANFAISLDKITNLLWYKLGNGFGNKGYPSSVNALLGARVILSTSIAKNAGRAYFDAKKQYESGIITKEQLAGRIIMLKSKPKLPEELQGDDIAEIMDFSPEYLNRYEEEHKTNQKALKEKDELIQLINAQAEATITEKDERIAAQASIITDKEAEISQKDRTIASQQNAIETKEEENTKLRAKLASYEEKESEKARKRNKWKRVFLFSLRMVLRLILVAAITLFFIWLCKKLSPLAATVAGIVVSILGLIPTAITIVQKDFRHFFPKA